MTDLAAAERRLRDDARGIARAGVDAVRADRLLAPALARWHEAREIRGVRGRLFAIAVGKAAGAMMRVCLEQRLAFEEGLIASTHVDGVFPEHLRCHLAGHPVPTAASEAAGRDALRLARKAGLDDELIVLLSGGASAILAAPADGVTLDDKRQVTRLLLAGGAAIAELNAVRKHLSAIKGGQLAAETRGTCTTLALSDVVGPVPNDPSVIGSGPTVADPSTFAEALAVVARRGGLDRLPPAVRARLEAGARGDVPETPKPGDPRLARAPYHLIGSRAEAMDAARSYAIDLGYSTVTIEAPIVGEARESGTAFLEQALLVSRRLPRPVCVMASGETTVRVTGTGRGGRNQELALGAAERLAALDAPAVLLSVGTDGIDGPTDAAGALVTTSTMARARAAGLDPAAFLANNDVYHCFAALGDLIITGPSDTNVGDLQVLLIGGPGDSGR